MYHKLLHKQIKKYLGGLDNVSEDLHPLLNAISESYTHSDNDRILIERSMELSSKELSELNSKLRDEIVQHELIFDKLRESIKELKGDSKEITSDNDLVQIAELLNDEIKKRVQTESELEESQANVFALIENVNESVLSLDLSGKLLIFNTSANQIYYDLHHRYLEIGQHIVSEDIGEVFFLDQEEFNKAIEGERFTTIKEYFSKGGRFFYEISINPIIADSAIVGVTLFAKNITSRKRNELLQEILFEMSEATDSSSTLPELYRSIAGSIDRLLYCENFMLVRYDILNSQLSFPFSKGKTFNEKSARNIRMGFIDNVIKDQYAQLADSNTNSELLIGSMKSVLGVPLAVKHTVIGGVYLISHDEHIVYNESDLSILQFLAGNIAISIERKESRLMLQESEQRYRKVVENIREVIFQTDITGNWTFLNTAWTEITGYSISESLNVNFLNFIHDEDKTLFVSLFKPLVTREQKYFVDEIRFYSKDKEIKWFKVFAQLNYTNDDQIEGIFGTLQDITETKKFHKEIVDAKNKAEAGARAKSEFLAIMSHEIRTPLNGILGMTQVIRDTELSKAQKDCLDIIDVSGQSLLAIINDILDFSKIEAGQMDLESHEFELIDCIEDSIHLCSQLAREKGIDIHYFVDEKTKNYLLGDVVRVRQILMNLVNNAIKFTEEGSVEVYVSELSFIEGISRMQFRVKDTGIGIPPEKMERLFRAFSQADTSISRKYGGTGLGLAICMKLCGLMNGKIWCESEEGVGTEFIFEIEQKCSNTTRVCDLFPELEKTVPINVEIKNVNKSTEFLLDHLLKPYYFFSEDKSETVLITADERNVVEGEKIIFLSPNGTNISETDNLKVVQTPVKHRLFYSTLFHLIGLTDVASITTGVRRVATFSETFAEEHPLDILIVEDNEINQKTLSVMLSKLGYSPDLAENGLTALEKVEHHMYDLILMDLQMPKMDGFQTTVEIFKRYDYENRPKIVALSANALDEDIRKCYEIGMDDYMSKPIILEELQNMLMLWS